MNLLTKQLKEIIDPKLPLMSNLANASAILNQLDNINWCGFYILKDNFLYLGPFQGEIACNIIPLNKGVCGYAASNKKIVIVDNVNEFPGHIACSTASKSEIVVPIIVNDKVKAVIDIDAPIFNRFNQEDASLLKECAKVLEVLFYE